MNFHKFAKQVNTQFLAMSTKDLFRVNLSKEDIYNAYLDSFPDGTNEIYQERREHDCQTCYQFIKFIGNAVTISSNGSLTSVWDIENVEYPYDIVAKSLSKLVKSRPINSIFLHNELTAGKETTQQLLPSNKIKTWNHFYAEIPQQFYTRDIATQYSKANARAQVHLRALNEITNEALQTVLGLITEDALYRGAEHLTNVTNFIKMKNTFDASKHPIAYAWSTYKQPGAGIRSSVIGTLLTDLADGVDLESAVKSFEAKVAPSNYKRPKKLVTQGMIDKAIAEIDNLGIRDSLPRRQAMPTDVSVNDILFVDRQVGLKDKDPLAVLLEPTTTQSTAEVKGLDNAPEIAIETFMSKILPSATSIELIISSKHSANKVQLSAPVNTDAPNILQWDNNFSWSYAGNVADSDMKERVKQAGGKVDGVLRCSLQWNEGSKESNNDLDLHCVSGSSHLYYGNKHAFGAVLDVDIQTPGRNIAVENITWDSIPNNGKYDFYVRNYSGQNKEGFRAEIEFDGEIYNYDYSSSVVSDIKVATVAVTNGKYTIKHHLQHSRTMNQQFIPVKMIMLSPNHWNGNSTGNKHYMFITDEEQDTAPFRGFYNEFLSHKLHEHRKVFDLLSSRMMCEPETGGLAGYGFSSTKRSDVHIKVDKKIYLLKF